MKTSLSFEQILSEKMGQKNPPESDTQRGNRQAESSDYRHLAYLMGHLGHFHFPLSKPKYTTLGPQRPTVKGFCPERKKHILCPEQLQALQFFLRFQQDLGESYTQEELKKAFRKLALRLHPDRHHGDSATFIELKKHHSRLESVFQTKA